MNPCKIILALLVYLTILPSLAEDSIGFIVSVKSTGGAGDLQLAVVVNRSSLADSCSVLCHKYIHDRTSPYYPTAEWLATSTATQCPVEKTSSNVTTCHVTMSNNVSPHTTYYVFCSGWCIWPSFFPVYPSCRNKTCGVKAESGHTLYMPQPIPFNVFNAASIVLVVVYVMWSFIFEYIRFMHETGVAVVVGLGLGYLIEVYYKQTASFRYSDFNYLLLPLVIFAAGVNLHKRNFFRYISYILSYGVVGTVIIFSLIYHISGFFEYDTKRLSSKSRLIMAAVLASTDTVAPIAFLPANIYPRVFAVVFGEGIMNDVVSILLSTAAAESSEIPSFFSMCGNIIYFFATSLLIGLAFGIFIGVICKHFKAFHEGVIQPSAVVFLLNYLCYIVCDMVDISAIFGLFISGVVTGHYALHSVSPKASVFVREFAEVLSYCAEAYVFGYFGMTAIKYITEDKYSVLLLLSYFLTAIFARVVTVLTVSLFIWIFRGRQSLLTGGELLVVGVAGCMRGTIAYALILRSMPSEPNGFQEHLIATILGIVLINALFIGPLFPVVLKLAGLTKPPPSEIDGLDLPPVALVSETAPEEPASEDTRAWSWSGIQRSWEQADDFLFKPFLRRNLATEPCETRQ